jgi:phosphatidylserine/phosphatidylglycerophosphate/cardiolipin synthase-like enzyme
LKLLIQPGDGVKPLIEAIDGAEERIEIAIFRFDRGELEKALTRAAERGVFVHALIAYTNRGGEKNLRQLELRLLAQGVTVARTADDLVRYHGKYMIVDRAELFLLGFNFTYLDMEHSRSFGLVTRKPELVREAALLFEADCKRQNYESGCEDFVVSPVNARERLAKFISGAKSELLIFDPKVGDPAMLRLLREREEGGVAIRAIGSLTRRAKLSIRELGPMRLHTRTIVRDRKDFFIGSQSLRATELETRREVGLIVRDPAIASQIAQVFEDDWQHSEKKDERGENQRPIPIAKAARKVAKVVSRNLPSVTPALDMAVRKVIGEEAKLDVDAEKLEAIVKTAVKDAVENSIRDAVEDVVKEVANEH